MTKISGLLPKKSLDQLVQLIRRYRDCFVWDYHEILGLSRELAKHQLSIKEGYKPHKQPARRFNPELLPKIQGEIERLFKAGFISIARYINWSSNIVPVIKKNGQVRICIDFRNLNLAMPTNEYVMHIADMLVDAVANNGILTFMDGYSGYNHIYLAK